MPSYSYLQPSDMVALPGRLASFWEVLTPEQQQGWLGYLTARIDQMTGHRGGLLAQTGVTWTEFCDRNKDLIFLPNKPITNVQSITVFRSTMPPFTLPCVMGTNILTWGGQSFKYVPGDFNDPYGSSWNNSRWPFQDGDTIQIVYDCGYATVPSVVVGAGRQLLGSWLMALADNPGGAASLGEGSAHVDFIGRMGILNPSTADADDALSDFTCDFLG